MDLQDWKDKLGAAFDLPLPDDKNEQEQPAEPASALEQQGKDMVNIVFEKKGRGGKQATIVTDLHVDDETLKQLASELKRHCGVGGSARGGEILVQGDVRNKVLAFFKQKGFKARII